MVGNRSLLLQSFLQEAKRGRDWSEGFKRMEMSKISPHENKIKLANRNSQGLLVIEVGYYEFKMVSISKTGIF